MTEACVDLFGVSGSGIMLADEQKHPALCRRVRRTRPHARDSRKRDGQGPCTEAFVNNAVVASTDVTAEPRWPDLAAALRPHGVRAVLGQCASVRLPSAPLTSFMTGRTSGRTTSARRWLAIAMSLNPRCPPPAAEMPASWLPSCSTPWTIG